MKKNSSLGEYLDTLFPNPKCELDYSTDYELLIAIVLSAQTTDKRVNMVTKELYTKYPSLSLLKNVPITELERILRPIGSFRKKAIYVHQLAEILDNDYNGVVPQNRDVLINLPGVGRKTTNVFLSEYYNEATIGVDTHVERVSKRLKIAKKNDSVLDVEKKLMKYFPQEEWGKRHLQLVLFGRYYCKAIKPLCDNCGIKDICSIQKKSL